MEPPVENGMRPSIVFSFSLRGCNQQSICLSSSRLFLSANYPFFFELGHVLV